MKKCLYFEDHELDRLIFALEHVMHALSDGFHEAQLLQVLNRAKLLNTEEENGGAGSSSLGCALPTIINPTMTLGGSIRGVIQNDPRFLTGHDILTSQVQTVQTLNTKYRLKFNA